ncbi:ENTS family enterobactin (siderophore) exporter [Spinactinospora alkalitolerans]|uniref:Multidrug efflux pump Tap n=1 Tax=Spinactinospora alkalitolerans TaxID=687207 RepID=A0A852TR25_9ACTN|nr:enterobactin transporter EntS [Spinactinospora alkalitolerans]NYE46846.1 ENTS family enterobactin (siderophore) exporter [Spinactinospora alkalitolerans]
MRAADLVIDLTPLRASREFRVLFAARLVSLFGIGFTMVALPLQVYGMTGSSFAVATVSTVSGLSIFCGTLVGGLLADRFDRRVLIVTGRAAGTAAFALFAVNTVIPEQPLLWVIYAGAALNGVLGTFSAVALQAAAPAIVGRDRLAAAGALLALTSELGSVAAPALGGAIIAAWGFGVNYTITAVASAATTVLVMLLPPLKPGGDAAKRPVLQAMAEGLRFATRSPVVGPLLLLGFVQLLFAMPQVLIPEFTDRVLGGGETAAGLLYTAPAVGALIGSLTSGWTGRVRRGGAVLLGAVGLCGLAVAGFGASPHLPLAFAVLVLLGLGQVIEEILRYSLIQAQTPDALRGRVNSVWTAQATVGGSLGAMTLGALAPLLGPGLAIIAGGTATVAAVAAIAALFPGLRRAGAAQSPEEAGAAEGTGTRRGSAS